MDFIDGKKLLIYWEPTGDETFEYIVDVIDRSGATERQYRFPTMAAAQAKHAAIKRRLATDMAAKLFAGRE